MNMTVLPGDRSRRERTLNQQDSANRTRKAAKREPGGVREEAFSCSGFDRVMPLVSGLLAGDDESVVPGQRAPGAEHGPRRVLLPRRCGHDLLKRRAAFAFEHPDNQAGL